MLGQFNSDYVKIGQIISGNNMLGHVSSGLVRLDKVRNGSA